MSSSERLPGSVRLGYAAGSLSTGAFSTVPGLLLLPYLTDTIGIAAALAGLLVLLPKAWDVFFNPIAGRISDRTLGPAGPRRPYLKWAGLALAILFAAMFAHPTTHTTWVTIYIVVMFMAAATAFAFYQVPYVAMPAEITDDPAERTRLMTRRIAVLAVAILAAGAGAPAIRDAIGGVDGYRVMGLAIGGLILIGAIWAYFGTARAPIGEVRPSAVSWRQTFDAVRSAPRFARLLIVFVIQAVGIGTMLAGVDYMARVVLASSGASSILFVAVVGPALLVMPLWQLVSRRWSKVRCYLVASLIFAAGAIGIAIVTLSSPRGHGAEFGWTAYAPLADATLAASEPGSPYLSEAEVQLGGGPPFAVIVALVALIGIGYAGQQVFPLSLLADLSAEAETESGEKRAGLFAGVWTAGETAGMALGPGIYGLILAAGSYISSDAAIPAAFAAAMQPSSAVVAIALGFTAIPALCVLAPLPLLRRIERP